MSSDYTTHHGVLKSTEEILEFILMQDQDSIFKECKELAEQGPIEQVWDEEEGYLPKDDGGRNNPVESLQSVVDETTFRDWWYQQTVDNAEEDYESGETPDFVTVFDCLLNKLEIELPSFEIEYFYEGRCLVGNQEFDRQGMFFSFDEHQCYEKKLTKAGERLASLGVGVGNCLTLEKAKELVSDPNADQWSFWGYERIEDEAIKILFEFEGSIELHGLKEISCNNAELLSELKALKKDELSLPCEALDENGKVLKYKAEPELHADEWIICA